MLKEKSILTVDEHGDKVWRNKEGNWHRIGGPAIEYSSGTKYWFDNGKQHRIDGPAVEWNSERVEWSSGRRDWYLRGKYFESKEAFFEALTDEEKSIALFSEDFHNA